MCHIFGIVYGKHININTAKLYFPLTKIFWNNKTFLTKQHLCSIIWHQNHFALQLLISLQFFIRPEAFISFAEKKLFEFPENSSISIFFFLNGFNENFGVPYSSTFAGLLGKLKTTRLERLTFILDVQKEVCLRNITCLQRRVHVITYLIWWSRN